MLNKQRSLSIIIDGSDQQSYGFPYFNVVGKEDSKGHKLRCKLLGAIVHGHFAMMFTQHENLPTGGNLTIEVSISTQQIYS